MRILSIPTAALYLLVSISCGDNSNPSDSGTDPSETWKDPQRLAPNSNGVYTLQFAPAKVVIEGKDYCLRTYNGRLAQLIDVPASATPRRLRIDMTNAFTTMDEQEVGNTSCGQPMQKHHFNVTNLHTHGLHVPPERTSDDAYYSDNVIFEAHPGGHITHYRFDIDEPDPHEAGTFWFHSHVHGSTAIQVANGVAGALLVRGAIDSVAGIQEARERVFLMQQIPFDFVDDSDPTQSVRPVEGDCDESKLSINKFALATAATRTLVNGVLAPTLVVRKNQVERWRLIHAGISQEISFAIRKRNADGTCDNSTDDPVRAIAVHQIAADGFSYAAAEQVNEVVLEPGYRADIMMTAPSQAGDYCVVDLATPQGLDGSEPSNVVAHLKVLDQEATAHSGAVPTDADLARVAKPVLDCATPLPTQPRSMVFAQQKHPGTGNLCEGGCPASSPIFNINCREYDASDSPLMLPFGQTEEWLLSSERSDHPFHIHINSFTVCAGSKVHGAITTVPHWRDTLLIRKADTSTGNGVDAITSTPIRIRTTYEDHKGKFVMHCHKLQHEDQGMMQQVDIH